MERAKSEARDADALRACEPSAPRAAESAESEPAAENGRASSQARGAGDRRASGPSAPRAA
eukprot:9747611-Alexandrium_andersonii.AAC.1